MESIELSTIYGERQGHLPLSVKVNTPLPLVLYLGNSNLAATRLAIGVRNFSTKLSVNNLKISSGRHRVAGTCFAGEEFLS